MQTIYVIPIPSILLQTTNSYVLVYWNILGSSIRHLCPLGSAIFGLIWIPVSYA